MPTAPSLGCRSKYSGIKWRAKIRSAREQLADDNIIFMRRLEK